MPTTYETKTGDTFEVISKREYGFPGESNRIAQANPGVQEPIQSGTVLTIPDLPYTPRNITQTSPSNNPNETSVLVAGQRFRFFEDIVITQSLDAPSSVALSAPFNIEEPGFTQVFRPFSYDPLVVSVGGSLLFSGTVIGVTPTVEVNRKSIVLSGYSIPGVLQDCTPPPDAFPLEFGGIGLQDIATKLCEPFGVQVLFKAAQGEVFEREVAIAPGTSVWGFLKGLAQQKGLVMSNNEQGALVFWKSKATGSPVARFTQGEGAITTVTPNFNPQKYYSSITGVTPTLIGIPGSSPTKENKFLKGVFRPTTFAINDTANSSAEKAVDAKLGRMFGNMASYTVEIPSWRDPQGDLWKPNTTLTLKYPDALILKDYEFVIRSVSLLRSKKSETATLNLVLPGSFSGEIPETLPWVL